MFRSKMFENPREGITNKRNMAVIRERKQRKLVLQNTECTNVRIIMMWYKFIVEYA